MISDDARSRILYRHYVTVHFPKRFKIIGSTCKSFTLSYFIYFLNTYYEKNELTFSLVDEP